MATTAFTIYSHYDPSQRELLERETGQISETDEAQPQATEVWEAEAFKARKRAPPPRFVKATMDDWRSASGASSSASTPPATNDENDVSSWYRSLTQAESSTSSQKTEVGTTDNPVTKKTKDVPTPLLHTSSSVPKFVSKQPTRQGKKPPESNWFIQKVLQSQSQFEHHSDSSSTSSLADILARDPPPPPSSGDKFHPPVFLALGPSNKGYALLENSGWTEGEALGPDVTRLARTNRVRESNRKRKRGLESEKELMVMKEVDAKGGDGEVKEMISVIDLTVSDSSGDEEDSDGAAEEDMGASVDEGSQQDQHPKTEDDELSVPSGSSSSPSLSELTDRSSARTALITPLPTVLKSDRLGIGLKAKTVGPYKASMKRVTHNSAALAAHLQRAEDARRRREKHGKGHRSFARQYKEEQRRRSEMQAYMNS
ncbi:hypothetical protein V5O48_001356 [Marasmius crinis-equi]|uniref:G-patch domain-containing protein n=1 Tax=Marasmius crinis-equi TaxID=585013 RepID=A0ABR3FYJ4_9AGAR